MERRSWAVLALCVVLAALNLWQVRQISDLQGRLGSVETNLQMEVRRVDERLAAVQREVRDADKLVQNWEVISVEPDPASHSLRAEVSLFLKEWREDTQVWLGAVQGPDTRYTAMAGGAGHYSGAVEISLNSQEVQILVRVSAEGLQKEEDLFSWASAAMLLPVQCFGWGTGGPDYIRDADKNGTLTVTGCEVNLTGFEGGTDLPQLSDQVFRLRRNGEAAAEKTAMFGNTIDRYTCEELSAQVQPGDEILLTFFCRDENGLGYEFFLEGWSIDEDGIKEALAPEVDWPKLTWDK